MGDIRERVHCCLARSQSTLAFHASCAAMVSGIRYGREKKRQEKNSAWVVILKLRHVSRRVHSSFSPIIHWTATRLDLCTSEGETDTASALIGWNQLWCLLICVIRTKLPLDSIADIIGELGHSGH